LTFGGLFWVYGNQKGIVSDTLWGINLHMFFLGAILGALIGIGVSVADASRDHGVPWK